MKTPDESIFFPKYNQANFLESIKVKIRDSEHPVDFVCKIKYDAKGQRTRIVYGNQTSTRYDYDPMTYRLTRLLTTAEKGKSVLQDLNYTYDPTGNVTRVFDDAQKTIFYGGHQVAAISEYSYDALYRLIEASGREHRGQFSPGGQDNFDDQWCRFHLQPNSPVQLRNYKQKFEYDDAGNLTRLRHIAGNGSWTRINFYYRFNNQLLKSHIGNQTYAYQYDEHGSIRIMPHLQDLQWNFREKLQYLDLGGGGKAWYMYDGDGQRTRKIIEHNGNKREERFYLGPFEIYRVWDGDTVTLERQTLHVLDDKRRIAMVDTRTQGTDTYTSQLIRYQYSNVLDSVGLELDEEGKIISYEEYHPYGTTAFQATDASRQVPSKRYRYTGKERDEESGLNYHGARYYAPWLSRWISTDPIGIKDGLNVYTYVGNNPIMFRDLRGTNKINDLIVYADKVLNKAGIGLNIQKDHTISQTIFKTILGPLESLYHPTRELTTIQETGAATASATSKWHTIKSTLEKPVQAAVKALAEEGKAISLAEDVVDPMVDVIKAASKVKVLPRQQYLGILSQLGNFHSSLTLEQAGKIAALIESGDTAKLTETVNKLSRSTKGVSKWMNVLRDIASKENLAAKAAPVVAKVAPIISKAAPVVSKVTAFAAKAAPVVAKLAPVAKVLGKVAGPLGVGIGLAEFAAARNNSERLQAGADTLASAAMFAGPVGEAFSVGYMAGGLLDKGIGAATMAAFGKDYSPSSVGADAMYETDQKVSKLWATHPNPPILKQ